MRSPGLPLLLLVVASVAAGCASSGHSAHMGGGTALLFGAKNEGDAAIEMGWTVSVAANSTVVWARTELLDAGEPVERIQPLQTEGEHRIDLSWGDGHAQALGFDTHACGGTMHILVSLFSDGTLRETTRECHM